MQNSLLLVFRSSPSWESIPRPCNNELSIYHSAIDHVYWENFYYIYCVKHATFFLSCRPSINVCLWIMHHCIGNIRITFVFTFLLWEIWKNLGVPAPPGTPRFVAPGKLIDYIGLHNTKVPKKPLNWLTKVLGNIPQWWTYMPKW